MTQYGFFFDESRCMDCRACVLACRDWYDLPNGSLKGARMFQWETGNFPYTQMHFLFAPCYQCQNPVCVPPANGALIKEAKYGAVILDPTRANDPALRAAAAACPYGAITFDSDSATARAFKCTMCVDRLAAGNMPVCVNSCPQRALDFGPLADIQKKYGTNSQLEGMPSPTATGPAVVFKPASAKTKLVPYDETKAIQLLMNRPGGLPAVFTSADALKPISATQVGRSGLKMMASSVKESLALTRTDEH